MYKLVDLTYDSCLVSDLFPFISKEDLDALFYNILNLMLVDFNWILSDWFISEMSSLYFTSPDHGRVNGKSPNYKSICYQILKIIILILLL